ncbi:hypothetical protein [Marinifilum sp.]|uniref:hypothetical protein n=1 Tax=Marinifilum sp. TaxID=2033137 RepID=UPI003BAD2769
MKYLYILAFFCVFVACDKEDVEVIEFNESVDYIKQINLYANSQQLFNDGIAEIEFLLKVYGDTIVTKVVEGDTLGEYVEVIDTLGYQIAKDRIPNGAIKIFTEDGEEVTGGKYSTTASAGTVSFYAKAGDVQSDFFTVDIEDKPSVDFDEITIPVIFHLISNVNNKYSIGEIKSENLEEMINNLNQVFEGSLKNAPHSVDLNVKFQLASQSEDGRPLKEKGLDRHNVGDAEGKELVAYVNENTVWDPEKYLNIWISDWYEDEYGIDWWTLLEYAANRPTYIMGDPLLVPFSNKSWKNMTQVDDLYQDWEKVEDIGIVVNTSVLFDTDNEISFEYIVGKFLGLIPTDFYSNNSTPLINGDVDFCSDTYLYEVKYPRREKYTVKSDQRVFYWSYNIMDEYSASTTITYEQALRIRKVLELCPHRQFRK